MTDFGAMPPFSLSVPRCPKCGELPRGTPVVVSGSAHLYSDNDGKTFQYNGHVQLGEAYKSKVDKEGRSILVCGGGHRWKAVLRFEV